MDGDIESTSKKRNIYPIQWLKSRSFKFIYAFCIINKCPFVVGKFVIDEIGSNVFKISAKEKSSMPLALSI